MSGLVILINGMPGVGKLTIARLLATDLGLRLIDNHTLINPAEAAFERGDPLYWPLRTAVRSLVLDALTRQTKPVRLIFTDALAAGSAQDAARFEELAVLTQTRGARLVTVTFICSFEENARRIATADRKNQRKLTDVAVLQYLRGAAVLLTPSFGDMFEIDVTDLEPQDAALAIKARIGQ